jgi:hypothetical protein
MSIVKGKMLLFSSESLGYGDAIIGYEVLATLFEILLKKEELPEFIIFVNTGVKICAEDSPMLPRLKRIEERGVKIRCGRFCVGELELKDKIAVGEVTPLGEIYDLFLQNDVISM